MFLLISELEQKKLRFIFQTAGDVDQGLIGPDVQSTEFCKILTWDVSITFHCNDSIEDQLPRYDIST